MASTSPPRSPLVQRIFETIMRTFHSLQQEKESASNFNEEKVWELAEKLDFLICFRHGRPAPPVTLETASVSIIIQEPEIYYIIGPGHDIFEHSIAFVYEGRIIVKFIREKYQLSHGLFQRRVIPPGEAEAAHLDFLDEVFKDLSFHVGDIIDGMLKEDITPESDRRE